MKLYPAQQNVADQIINAYQLPQVDKSIYLSGEMGVGKTYIGAYLAHWMIHHNQRDVVIAVPSIVTQKWIKVLKSIDDDVLINQLTPKKYDEVFNNPDHQPSINVINNINLKSLSEQAIPYINLIIDEVQELNEQKLKYLAEIMPQTQYKLQMTGTIFDNLDTGLPTLIKMTNPTIWKYAYHNATFCITGDEFSQNLVKDLPMFMQYVWQYISVSLSLREIKADSENLLIQNIEPIEYLPLTDIEHANYDLAVSANKQAHPELFASNLLDDPDQEPIIENTEHGNLFVQPKINFVSLPLEKIPFEQTEKYQALTDYLDEIDLQNKVIIYANTDHIIQKLCKTLNDQGYKADCILKRSTTIQKYINQTMQDNDILVINPNLIKVGIDINAQYIIWYQLLDRMTDILQAQRRITRLNSDTPSNIKYLAYDHTSQRKLLDNISIANKSNAAAYGVNDDSNLSKITGLLLPKE